MFFWLIKLEVFTTLPLLDLASVIDTKWYSHLSNKHCIKSFESFYKEDLLHGLDFELSEGTIYKCQDN